VHPEQVAAAEARGLVNVPALAAACTALRFPFFLALAIVEKESRGRNVYGNDAGDAMAGRGEVTEANFAEFRRMVDAGRRSNGVGPMQITFRGYFPMAEARGLRLWIPADNMLFGIGILADKYNALRRAGKSPRDAFRETARSYNAGAQGAEAYAADAVAKAEAWLAVVGNSDAPGVSL
jgi:hypothetical protein